MYRGYRESRGYRERPKRSGRRMWCLPEKRSVRVRFMDFSKRLMQKARDARQLWLSGDVSVRYPPGIYPPRMPKLANVVVGW